ncbi:hypothetical protein JTB14_028048 [Gonioctena quinquepunctata]|nr:hypothetical protein JTB14_028048 [Gonioctena quinquepunctata]
MNTQMFDFKTPPTFLKSCNFVVQISNEDYIGKEAEISCNGDVSQTANQSASFNMNQLDQLDSSLPSTSKSSGHDKICSHSYIWRIGVPKISPHYRNISDRIRELGRLLIAAKKIDPSVNRLSQLINADKYQLIKNSVKLIAGFDETTSKFKSPSLVIKIGITLKKCASILRGDYMEDDDLHELIPQIDAFLGVLEAKWTRELNFHAHRTLTGRKWNAPKRLPLAKDIQILHAFLKSRNDDLHNQLNSVADKYGFQELAEITLVRTLILNRRRVGEIQYMLLSDFIKAKSADPNSDVFQVLSSAEQELSKLLKRLVIKGKKGRGVPVLLTEDLQSSLDLLIELRDSCEINSDNPYLFLARTTAGHFRAHVLLKKYANLAGCEFVDSITSTRLRKHIATMTQLLNLKDHELDSLAKFMGHDIRVHREYNRLSDETTQLAEISKLLIRDKGDFNRLKKKSR